MYFLLTFVSFNLLLVFGNCSTRYEDSQKNFANLCFAPKPIIDMDLDWLITGQVKDGLHSILGNDIIRLHHAQVLKGEKLSLSDNFDGICLTERVHNYNISSAGTISGNYFGFDNLTTNFKCKFSKDFPQLLMCDNINQDVTNYHEKFNAYISYTDHTNFVVDVFCYPNGEVGWVASAISRSFTDADKKNIIDHVTSLGFSQDSTVTLYEEKYCSCLK